jgi:hypothetical protein
MVFSTPENGGTTSGSSYPRNELRQTSAGANWKLTDTTTKGPFLFSDSSGGKYSGRFLGQLPRKLWGKNSSDIDWGSGYNLSMNSPKDFPNG